MTTKINVGFIGFGGQAEEQFDLITKTRHGSVVAIAEIDPLRRDYVRNKFPAVSVYSNYKDMIGSEKLKVVYVCVPHNLHKEICMYAIKCGLNIIKEKPFTMNSTEALELTEMIKKSNVSVLNLMQRRQHSAYTWASHHLGCLGNIFLFQGTYTFNGGPYNYGWRGVKAISGGGAIIDMGYHILDMILWFFGRPESVFAVSTNKSRADVEYETEDSAILTFKYHDNRLLGSLFLSRATQPKEEFFKIYGSRGYMIVTRNSIKIFNQQGGMLKEKTSMPSWEPSILKQMDDFFAYVEQGKKYTDIDHLEHMKICEALYESVDMGKMIDL